MTTLSRDEILSAYEALDELYAKAGNDTSVIRMRSRILAALPPRPRTTMADIEWGDDKHHLAEAEHPDYGKVIMLNNLPVTESVSALVNDDGMYYVEIIYSKELTPTGHRYNLVAQDD